MVVGTHFDLCERGVDYVDSGHPLHDEQQSSRRLASTDPDQLFDLYILNPVSFSSPSSYHLGYQSAEVELLRKAWWEAGLSAEV
jgi:hypothetical protein